jgi:hypothetical protein
MHWPISVWEDKRMLVASTNNKFAEFYPALLAEGWRRDMSNSHYSHPTIGGSWKWGCIDHHYSKRGS